jgi:5-bromo-4-chloroindolyl phosphate hydrolysis protein
MDKAIVQERLTYWREQLGKLMDAYAALISGGVKSYQIDDRQLTRFDIPSLRKAIDEAEEKVDRLETLLKGIKPRKAFGILPRDW